jgi:hypothetical protein
VTRGVGGNAGGAESTALGRLDALAMSTNGCRETVMDTQSSPRFHEAGLEAGGKDNGTPGIRVDYAKDYYAAFLFDPDGNNVEAVSHGE